MRELAGRRILLVGGAGFIGHHLALYLSEFGAEVHVIDSLQVNNLGQLNSDFRTNPRADLYLRFIEERLSKLRAVGVNLHVQDARDYHLVSRTISEVEPDVVVHLAAIAHANKSNKDPFQTFDHSLRTLENVLDAIRNNKTRLVYFSSSMVYGNFDGEAVDENRQCRPMGIYGSLKYAAETMVRGYSQVFDVPVTIVRPSALYGERCVSRRVGQAFIENALVGKDLTINGDGLESLDFTYVRDLVEGIALAMTNEKAVNETFNLTYGEARPIIDLASIVIEYFPTSRIELQPRDNLMPERGTLDISKAKELLGYSPKHPVEVGFRDYINWYQNFKTSNPAHFQA